MSGFLSLAGLLVGRRADNHVTAFSGERTVVWDDFSRNVAGLFEYMAGHEAERWVLTCTDPLAFVTSLFAAWHARKRPVVPPNLQPGTLASLLSDRDGVLDDASVQAAPAARARFDRLNPVEAKLDLYTSGSTGEPKLVTKQLRQLDAEVATLEQLWGGMLGNAAVLTTVPHHHIYGLLFHLLWPLAAGRPFDTPASLFPERLCERAARLRDTVLVSSPARLARWPSLFALDSMQPCPRLVFSSGGPLSSRTAALYHDTLGHAPVEVYGSTETGGIAWRRQDNEDTAWTVFPGVTIAPDVDGALTVASPHLPDEGTFRTEDRIEPLPDGRFLLRGRLDRTIKVEEKRLSLPDMEERLRQHAWVDDAAVTMLHGRRQFLGAVVILNATGRRQSAALSHRQIVDRLRTHLREYFEPVLLPRHWRFPDALPCNERGKVAHAMLSGLFSEQNDGSTAS